MRPGVHSDPVTVVIPSAPKGERGIAEARKGEVALNQHGPA